MPLRLTKRSEKMSAERADGIATMVVSTAVAMQAVGDISNAQGTRTAVKSGRRRKGGGDGMKLTMQIFATYLTITVCLSPLMWMLSDSDSRIGRAVFRVAKANLMLAFIVMWVGLFGVAIYALWFE